MSASQPQQQKQQDFKQFKADEVAKHNKKGDLWIVIDSLIYDLTKFAAL